MNRIATRKVALATALLPLLVTGVAASAQAPATTTATQPSIVAAHAIKPAPTLPPPSAAEVQAGIQVTHIGSTASGGLVDARFRVLDAAKVSALLASPADAPMLIAGDKPPLMAPHHSLKGGRFAKNQVFVILYPNTRGAVQPGTSVMVAMGSTRLGPVTAQ